MIIKIGIVDSDREYVSRLENVLSGYEGVEIYTYTDSNNLEENLKSTKLDIVLFSDDMYFTGMERVSRLMILFLDETGESSVEFSDYAKVNKYQRISNIYKLALEQYASVAGITSDLGEKATKVITYWSPVGGIGKTTLSMAAATKLAREGKSVFYINFETYPSDDAYLEDKLGKGIRELAADLNKDINFEYKIKGIVQEKIPNFFYMKHFDKVIDLKDTSEDELAKLVEVIVNYGSFDYVIVDIDSSINTKNQRMLTMADKVFLISSNDAYAVKKMNAYYDELINRDVDHSKYFSIRNKLESSTLAEINNEAKCVAKLPLVSGSNEKKIDALANSAEMSKIIGVL